MNVLVNIWSNIGILGKNKIGLVYLVSVFVISLVSVWWFRFVIFLKMTSLQRTNHRGRVTDPVPVNVSTAAAAAVRASVFGGAPSPW